MATSMFCKGIIPGFAVLAGVLCGCFSNPPAPDLGPIYNRAAQHHDEKRNPVIVIPGILGSRLVDKESGRLVWGAFTGDYADPETPEGARLVAIPMGEGQSLEALTDDIRATGVLDRVKIKFLGLPIELKAYINILKALGVGGYRDEELGLAGAVDYGDDHYSCFQFPYDWRRDNVENARALHRFILEKGDYVKAELEKRYGKMDGVVKFDIVAHSMGGLLARYYLRYGTGDLPKDGSLPPVTWAGLEHVDRLILVGTPNAGSIKALTELTAGVQFAPILPCYEPAVIGTFPSIYQLLPRPRHGAYRNGTNQERRLASANSVSSVYDVEVWKKLGWGLAAPGQDEVLEDLLPKTQNPAERRKIALDHLEKCLRRAEQFTAALDRPVSPPKDLHLYLFAGDAVDTPAAVSIAERDGSLEFSEYGPGDGTVLRSSALMDERIGGAWVPSVRTPIPWRQVTFLFSDHLGLTKDPAFTDNVLYLLLEDPR